MPRKLNDIERSVVLCLVRAVVLSTLACLQIHQAVLASDVTFYDVKKGQTYTQSNSTPEIDAANGYTFYSDVSPPYFVYSAYVLLPTAITEPTNRYELTLTTSQTRLQFSHKSNTGTTLNNKFPDGRYTNSINTVNDGQKLPTLLLQGQAYPNAPQISNFSQTQKINANAYFEFTWFPFTAGTSNDFIQFHLEELVSGNKVIETPNIGKVGAYDGTATRALIAPGVLNASTAYKATLEFAKIVSSNTTAYPGALGLASYYSETTLYPVIGATVAPDVKNYEVSKSSYWLQTGSGPAVADPTHGYQLNVSVAANNTGILTTGSLQPPPPAASVSLVLQSDLATLAFTGNAASPAALDALYGSGNYTFVFPTVNDGSKSLSLALGADAYPPAPHISNLNAIQGLNANQDITVSWDPWVGGTFNDFVQLRVEDQFGNKVYDSANPGKVGALNGLATSAPIPLGQLVPGGSYSVRVTFKRIITQNTTNYPGVLGLADFTSRTRFDLLTAPPNATSFGASKGQVYSQTGSGAPVLLSSNAYGFESQVQASAPGAVVSASVNTPLGGVIILAQQPGGMQLSFSNYLSSKSALDAAYPDGTYLMNIATTTDGPRNNLPMLLTVDAYPNAPHVTNLPAAQSIDPSTDFILGWDAFAGATAGDVIQLVVTDAGGNLIFQVPASALSGLTTAAVIPANTLASNQVYSAVLKFIKLVDGAPAGYPGAQDLSGFAAATRFTLDTHPFVPPPNLTFTRMSPGHFQLNASVVSGKTYRFDGGTNLVQWTPFSTNTAAGTLITFPVAPGAPFYFYRAIVQP